MKTTVHWPMSTSSDQEDKEEQAAKWLDALNERSPDSWDWGHTFFYIEFRDPADALAFKITFGL